MSTPLSPVGYSRSICIQHNDHVMPKNTLDWELGNNTSPETKGFDLMHRRPQIGVEVSMSNLYPISSHSTHLIIKN